MVEKYKFMSGILFTALWIQLCWGFVCTDVIPALEPTRNYVNLLLDGIYLVLGIVTIRSRRDIFVFVSFVTIALISAFLNNQGLLEFFNGFRDFIGLLFAAPIIRYFLRSNDSERFVKSFDKMLYVFLWIQVPCLVSQYIRFGAGDAGGGSLGDRGSGIVSTFIYVISFYLINKKWDDNKSYIQNIWDNRILVFLLFPTFLNETKISFIYFIGYFILLMKMNKRFVIKMIVASPVVIVASAVLGYIYLKVTNSEDSVYDIDYFYEYLVGEDFDELVELSQMVQDGVIDTENLWVVDLPRYGRFTIASDILADTGGGTIFGAGIGQFKGGNVVGLTNFAAKYDWYLKGSYIMLFFMLIQLGLFGVVWMIYAIFSLICTPNNYLRATNMLFFALMIALLIMVYNDQYRQPYVCLIHFYIFMRGLQPKVID